MRRAARRDDSEKAVVDALRRAGWSVDHISIPNGPDLLAGKSGMTVLIEAKTGKAKLRPGQAAWHQNWRGGPVVVVRSVEEALVLGEQLEPASYHPTNCSGD